MRTTLDIPEKTLESARRAANLRTKRETVIATPSAPVATK
jgi:hypothetical protein